MLALGLSNMLGGSSAGGVGMSASPPTVAAGATGVVLTLRTNMPGTVTWSFEVGYDVGGKGTLTPSGKTATLTLASGWTSANLLAARVNVTNIPAGGTLSETFTLSELGVSVSGYAAFLDAVSVSATAAYGVSKMRAAYAGSCLRVRRSSDNAESDFGFGSDGLLDTTALLAWAGSSSAYVVKWYDQSGNGYDAAQTTASKQPRFQWLDKSAENLGPNLATNGTFDSAANWNVGQIGTGAVGSIGSGVANLPRINSSNFGLIDRTFTAPAGFYKITLDVLAANVKVRVGTSSLNGSYLDQAVAVGTGRQIYVNVTAANPVITFFTNVDASTGQGDNVTFQQVISGSPSLFTDGADDGLVTPSIDLTGTDKTSVFAALRKQSDAAQGMLAEFSANSGTTAGTFSLQTPAGASSSYAATSRGSATATATYTNAAVAAPRLSVLCMTADISGDSVKLYENGSQIASSTTDQGTGSFGNQALNLFSRNNGASLPSNGLTQFLILFPSVVSSTDQGKVEFGINAITGAY